MNNCINCNNSTKNPKFCSRKCSASYTTKGRKHSIETRRKISRQIGGKGILNFEKIKFCKRCCIPITKSAKIIFCEICSYHFNWICESCGKICMSEKGLLDHLSHCGIIKIGIDKQGYEYFIDSTGKFKYFHREVVEKSIKRKLKSNEVIHHKDGNKRNNNINNLQITNFSDHVKLYHARS